jgi:pimeloyl-ACP methyl ester carboxylesterase
MASVFEELINNGLAEIRRRDASFRITIPSGCALEEPQCSERLLSILKPADINEALRKGVSYISSISPNSRQQVDRDDVLAGFLIHCIMDAFLAETGIISLLPCSFYPPLEEVAVATGYSMKRVPGRGAYYVRQSGTVPLLLINATGSPIAIWNRFLMDPWHDFKIIIPCRRGVDLLRGGFLDNVDIEQDSTDLVAILRNESLACIDVLAWCNGARVAVDLASRDVVQIKTMTLLCPMLKGVQGVPPDPSVFERDLQPLLDAALAQPDLAAIISKSIASRLAAPDWTTIRADANLQAQMLFALPAQEHAYDVVASLIDSRSLLNIARRVASDDTYQMRSAIERLKARTLLIFGSHDTVVSNKLTHSAFRKMCKAPTSIVTLQGAGHYIQDLQYQYLRWFLTEFVIKESLPDESVRAATVDCVQAR